MERINSIQQQSQAKYDPIQSENILNQAHDPKHMDWQIFHKLCLHDC